jgi:hypothetical protein
MKVKCLRYAETWIVAVQARREVRMSRGSRGLPTVLSERLFPANYLTIFLQSNLLRQQSLLIYTIFAIRWKILE